MEVEDMVEDLGVVELADSVVAGSAKGDGRGREGAGPPAQAVAEEVEWVEEPDVLALGDMEGEVAEVVEEEEVELEEEWEVRQLVDVGGRSSLGMVLGWYPLARLGLTWRLSEIIVALLIFLVSVFVFVWHYKAGWKGAGKAVGVVMQVMFIPLLVPVTRRSILLMLSRCSYERAIFFHKWVGRYIVFLGLVHCALLFVYYFEAGGLDKVVKEILKFNIFMGLVAFVAMLLLTLFSLPWVRSRLYELFMKTHYVLFLIAVIFSGLHKKRLQFLMLVGVPLVLYAIDKLLQVYYTGRGRARITHAYAIADRYIRLEFETQRPYKPLQWAYLIIPAVSMVQAHAFSYASCPSGNGRASVLVKVNGNWTAKLMQVLKEKPEALSTLYADGPFGTLTVRKPNSYSDLLLVAGGGGAPPLLGILKSTLLNNAMLEDTERQTHVTFVWVCRSPLLFLEYAAELQRMEATYGHAALRVCFYQSREVEKLEDFSMDFRMHELRDEGQDVAMDNLGATEEEGWDAKAFVGERLLIGRPDIREIMTEMAERARVAGSHRVGVVTCCPKQLSKSVVSTAASVATCGDRVRFDVHREVYSV